VEKGWVRRKGKRQNGEGEKGENS